MKSSEPVEQPPVRLNKHIALQLGVSRREADQYIAAGKVTVDNTVALLGARVTTDNTIHVNGKQITSSTGYRYLIFHKPSGYVTSRRAQGDNPTIYSLLSTELHALKPAGRLDKDSSGLIILTNDGDFAFQLTHPKFHKTKQYKVSLDHDLAPLHQQMISDYGITLEDGVSKLQLERQSDENRQNWHVLMHEGRNRQIRRTFAALGYTVTKLHRTQFGKYTLGTIKEGEYKEIII